MPSAYLEAFRTHLGVDAAGYVDGQLEQALEDAEGMLASAAGPVSDPAPPGWRPLLLDVATRRLAGADADTQSETSPSGYARTRFDRSTGLTPDERREARRVLGRTAWQTTLAPVPIV